MHGHDLAKLNKGRPHILQDRPQLFRGQASNQIVPAENAQQLPETAAHGGIV